MPPEIKSLTSVAFSFFSAKTPQVLVASNKPAAAFLISTDVFSSLSRPSIISLIPYSPSSLSRFIVLSIKTVIGFIMSSPNVIIQSYASISVTSSKNVSSTGIPCEA